MIASINRYDMKWPEYIGIMFIMNIDSIKMHIQDNYYNLIAANLQIISKKCIKITKTRSSVSYIKYVFTLMTFPALDPIKYYLIIDDCAFQ